MRFKPHHSRQPKKEKTRYTVWCSEFLWLRRWDFHCPVPSHSRRLSPSQVFGSADFLLWGLPSAKTVINCFMPRHPFPSSRRSSRAKPAPQTKKKETHTEPWFDLGFFCARAIKKIFLPFCLRDLNLTKNFMSLIFSSQKTRN